MTLPFQVFFSAHLRVLPVPVVARKYDGDFLFTSGKFLWISLEVIVFYGVDISRVGLRLENHGGSCRTPNSELPTLETLAYLLNHPLSSSTFFWYFTI